LNYKEDYKTRINKRYYKMDKQQRMTKVIEEGSWSHHTYSHEEKEAFCSYVNFYLQDDPDLK
jgi:hypothetical protein